MLNYQNVNPGSLSGCSVASTIDSLIISGLPHPDAHRDTVLLSSLDTGRGSGSHLLAVKFETSPLDSDFDQIVNLSAQPVEIIYDAVSGWGIKSNLFIYRISQSDSGVFTIKTINVKIKFRKITIIYITRQSLKSLIIKKINNAIKILNTCTEFKIIIRRGVFKPGTPICYMGLLWLHSSNTPLKSL